MIRCTSVHLAVMVFAALSAAALSDAQPAPASTPETVRADHWQPLIDEAARHLDLPAVWIRAVMLAESGGRTTLNGRPITSRAGAMGLMQVMPATYEEMRRAHNLGSDPHDPRDNILAGAAYLRTMFDRYGYPGLFAAYNAGPGRYDAYLAGHTPLPDETRSYIASLNHTPPSPVMPPAILSGVRLFFPLSTASSDAGETSSARQASPLMSSAGELFVPLRIRSDDAP